MQNITYLDKKQEADVPGEQFSPYSAAWELATQKAEKIEHKKTRLNDYKGHKPVSWIVEGMIPTGLTICGGASTAGKTNLAIQLASCVAEGRPFLGMTTAQGNVNYFMLEKDSGIYDRFKAHSGDSKPSDNIFYYTELNRFPLGLQELDHILQDELETRLNIIDMWSMVAPKNREDYLEIYPLLSALDKIARQNNQSLLINMHLSKAAREAAKNDDDDDFFASVLGSVAMTSAGSAALVLTKESSSQQRVLRWRCTNVAGARIALDPDPENGVVFNVSPYSYNGRSFNDYERSVYHCIFEGYKTQPEIVRATGYPRQTVNRIVKRLIESKVVEHDINNRLSIQTFALLS